MSRLVTFGETALKASPPGHERLESARTLRLQADGTESNVAITASNLDTATVWLSKVPDSPLGRRMVSELHQHELQTEVVWAARNTGRQGLAFHEKGAPPREDITLQDRDRAATATAEPGELSMTLVTNADAFFIGGSTLALSPSVRQTGEAMLRAAEGKRVLDLDHQPGLWTAANAQDGLSGLLDAVDILIANEDDARAVFDRSGKPREIVHSIAADWSFDQVVVTRSEHGAIAWDDNVMHEVDAVESERVDASGQHEAFIGGYLSAILADEPTEAALQWANAAAAVARTVPGPIPALAQQEVEAIVERQRDAGRSI
jgi:2-dehydro-3-deoxygluconokinase